MGLLSFLRTPHTRLHACLTLRSGSSRCVCEFVWLPRVHTVYVHVLLAPSGVVLGPERGMIRNFTCNRSMWRTCYWLGAFSRASVGPLNLRGSPWEQYWRPEEFNTVNVQPFLISAEKSHSMNSSQAFPAVERVWMASQKTVNTLPCLPLFISLTLGKHTGYKARFQGLLTFNAHCQGMLQLILPFLSAFFFLLLHKFPQNFLYHKSKKYSKPTKESKGPREVYYVIASGKTPLIIIKSDEIMLLWCFF